MTRENSEQATAELVDRAEVMGGSHGARRFWLTSRGFASRISVPPELADRTDTARAYLLAEQAGYLGAVEDFEAAKRRAQNARS